MVASKKRKEKRKVHFEQAQRNAKRQKKEEAAFGDYEDANQKEGDATNNHDMPEQVEGDSRNAPKADAAQDSKTIAPGITVDANGSSKVSKVALRQAESHKRKAESVRFICFVGKLPYSATTEAIEKHFAKVEPTSVRHATSKETGKSRGFAFLEFDRFERQKDCLRLYHHSMFDDGLGGEPRRINIELTAGGGGKNSQERRERIRAKNEKLDAERLRRAALKKESKARNQQKTASKKESKARQRQEAADNTEKRRQGKREKDPGDFRPPGEQTVDKSAASGANVEAAGSRTHQNSSIHPSRLARIKGI